jgi:dipeptidyl aminopeptidase/acylaminoacyl peptidase
MVALAGDRPEFAQPGEVSTKVKAVVGVYGVYDLVRQWEHDLVHRSYDRITEKLLGVGVAENRRLYFDASPLSYVTRDNNQTAFQVVWGTADDIVNCREQSEEFLRALKLSGAYTRPVVVSGAPHFWMDDPIDEPTSHSGFLANRMLRFLQAKL